MTDSNETQALRDAIRDVLEDRLDLVELRRRLDGGEAMDELLWKRVSALGWPGLALPEAYGGSALGVDSICVLYEEAGRYLAPLPLLPTALCAQAVLEAGSDAQRDAWLPAIARGECIAAVASPADAIDGRLPSVRREGAGLVLGGRVGGFLASPSVRLLLVFARDEAGSTRALLLEPARDGFTIDLVPAGDRTRGMGEANFDALRLPGERMLAADGRQLAGKLLVHAALALACDSIGGADRIFGMTVEYLKTRQQFGRPIGSFQALKHRAADLKVLLAASEATVREALDHAEDVDAAQWASMAKFCGGDAYARTAAEAIQLHGGIGFTWEHPCHLFLKRAKLNQQMYGGPEWHRDRAARLLVGEIA